MKLLVAAVLVAVAAPALTHAFAPSTTFVRKNAAPIFIGRDPNVELGGNSWKPDSEKMGSTDTGDYFPEGYDPNAVDYTEGMGGSQAMLGGDRGGPQLPGTSCLHYIEVFCMQSLLTRIPFILTTKVWRTWAPMPL